MHMMGTSLCTMSKQALYQAEISPFHPDSLIRVRTVPVETLDKQHLLLLRLCRLCNGPNVPRWVGPSYKVGLTN